MRFITMIQNDKSSNAYIFNSSTRNLKKKKERKKQNRKTPLTSVLFKVGSGVQNQIKQ